MHASICISRGGPVHIYIYTSLYKYVYSDAYAYISIHIHTYITLDKRRFPASILYLMKIQFLMFDLSYAQVGGIFPPEAVGCSSRTSFIAFQYVSKKFLFIEQLGFFQYPPGYFSFWNQPQHIYMRGGIRYFHIPQSSISK